MFVNKGGEIKLIVKQGDERMPCHVGMYINITTANAKGVALSKVSFGANSLSQIAKLPVVETSMLIETAGEVLPK